MQAGAPGGRAGSSLCRLSLGGPFPGAQHGQGTENSTSAWRGWQIHFGLMIKADIRGGGHVPRVRFDEMVLLLPLFLSQAQKPSLVMRKKMTEESQLSDLLSRAPQTAKVIQNKGSLRNRHSPEGPGETEGLSAMRCPG